MIQPVSFINFRLIS